MEVVADGRSCGSSRVSDTQLVLHHAPPLFYTCGACLALLLLQLLQLLPALVVLDFVKVRAELEVFSLQYTFALCSNANAHANAHIVCAVGMSPHCFVLLRAPVLHHKEGRGVGHSHAPLRY